MNYLEHIGKYFIMLGRVFKKPQRSKVFYEALLREIEDLGLKSLGIIMFISFFIGGYFSSNRFKFRESIYSKIINWFCCKTLYNLRICSYFLFYYLGRKSGVLYHL